jgi:hypothetical protein
VIKVFRGNDVDMTFTFTDAAGVAINLAGSTVTGTVKKSIEDADASAKITKALTIAAPATGVGVLTLLDTELVYLRGLYFFYLQLVTGAGLKRTVFKSDFYVDDVVKIV